MRITHCFPLNYLFGLKLAFVINSLSSEAFPCKQFSWLGKLPLKTLDKNTIYRLLLLINNDISLSF